MHRLTPRRLTCLHFATTLSILYQRGLYPPESFERKNAHGISVLVSTHPGLRDYLAVILRQLGGERPSPPEQVVQARLVCVLSPFVFCPPTSSQTGCSKAHCRDSSLWWPALRRARCWSGGSSTWTQTRRRTFDLLSLCFARSLTPLTYSRSEQGEQAPPAAKSEKEISSEIAAIIRQACAQMLVP